MTYSFIIPAFNEAAVIGQAVGAVLAYAERLAEPFEVIVVDDGSRDTTAAVAAQAAPGDRRVRVISLATNQGKGAAVRAGMLAAHGQWRIFLDADLSTAPAMLDRFLPHLGENDILIASRAVAGATLVVRQSFFRECSGRLFNAVVRGLVGLPFADTQCGFKVFAAHTMDVFERQEFPGWAFDVEVLVRALRRNYRVREIPVVWKNDPTTTVRTRAALRALHDIWRIRQRAQNW